MGFGGCFLSYWIHVHKAYLVQEWSSIAASTCLASDDAHIDGPFNFFPDVTIVVPLAAICHASVVEGCFIVFFLCTSQNSSNSTLEISELLASKYTLDVARLKAS